MSVPDGHRRRAINGARLAAGILALAAAYFLTAKAGLALAGDNASVTAVWAPSGVAVAALVIWGRRLWPGVALGAFLANITTAGSLAAVLGISAGNTLEAVVGASLLALVGFQRALPRVRDVVALAILAAGVGTLVSATVGVASLWADGNVLPDALGSTWVTWWIGDLAGILLVAPAILVLSTRPAIDLSSRRALEAIALVAALTATCLLVFSQSGELAYTLFPLLFVAALRFRQTGAVLAALLVSALAVWATARGNGPFASTSHDASLLMEQLFVAIASATALCVAAVWSQRREAESVRQALSEAQELAELGSWEWHISDDRVHWSDTMYGIFGLDPRGSPATYSSYLEHVHPDDRAYVEREIGAALEGRPRFQFQHRVIRPSGEERIVRCIGDLIRDGDGQPLLMRGTSQDITDHVQLEDRFQALLESAPDAMVIVNEQGAIVLVNAETERMFGYGRAELIGQSVEMLIPAALRGRHKAHRQRFGSDPHRREMGSGVELYANTRDGAELPVEVSLSPLDTRDGMLISAAIRDTSDRQKAQREAQRLKDEFFALISHELRTPLTSIVGYTELLSHAEADRLDDASTRYLEVIQRNAQRELRLVHDLLTLVNMEAGSFAIHPEPVDVQAVIEEAIADVSPDAERHNVRITTDLGPLPVCAIDPERLGQALDNLLTNAVKFTPSPGGEVVVRGRSEGDRIVLEVKDQGIGIPPADVPRLFDRLYRSSEVTSAQIPGTGLGLSIVKAIVEAHGGSVSVRSAVGAGTTMLVELPVGAASVPVGLRATSAA